MLYDEDVHDLIRHFVEVTYSLLSFFALRHIFSVQIVTNLTTESFVLDKYVQNIVNFHYIVQIEEQVRHINALLRQGLEFLLAVQECQLLHLV